MSRDVDVRHGRRTEALRRLYPGYFALVMATGIVSVGAHDVEMHGLSAALLVIGLVCFGVLVVCYLWRAVAFGRELLADLVAPDRAFAFFTFVAACNVLGARLATDGYLAATAVLAAVSMVVWLLLSYGIPVRLILGPRPSPVLAGVNGTWFIWVVGTQSLAVAATVLGTAWPAHLRTAALAAVVVWSVGVVLYLIVASLVLVRLLLLDVRPDDLTPPYWVTMGATAITVFAAGRLSTMPEAPAVAAARPVIEGLAAVLWAFGTWLIPLLIVFGFWRHVLRRVPLTYQPPLWSIVFPLGMYAVASIEFGEAADLPIIASIGRGWVWIGLSAWTVVFAAMLTAPLAAAIATRPASRRLALAYRTRRTPAQPGQRR
ncbi:MAG TPA: tellurite resistance/C4-dicarboxylate transporter family protein [Jiangellaceae bacterium]